MDSFANELQWYFGGYALELTRTGAINACYYEALTKNATLWTGTNPMFTTVYNLGQLSIIIFIICLFLQLFKCLNQPRFLAEMMGGLVIGPVLIGQNEWFSSYVHPLKSTKTFELLSHLGLFLYMFLVGLEMDVTTLKKIEKKALCNALAGILFPSAVGAGLHFWLVHDMKYANHIGAFIWAVALTVTSFPDLARVLSDLKLLHTDIGRMALSTAFINDLAAWGFLALALTFVNMKVKFFMMPTIAYVLMFVFLVRPLLKWMVDTKISPKGDNCSNFHICFILAVAAFCGFITDVCGSHAMTGGFMFGLMMPNGQFSKSIAEKLENFVSGILLPAFLVVTGNRTNLIDVKGNASAGVLVAIIIALCLAKVVSGFLVSMFCHMSLREGVTLGVLMNTKGILALIILNVGRDIEALDNQTFSVMVIALLVMTIPVKPFPIWACKSKKRVKKYKRRTMEAIRPGSELRMLTCIHASYSLTGMMNLAEFCNSDEESPIFVVAVHLIELTGRSTAMLIVHDPQTFSTEQDLETVQRTNSILGTLENYESRGQAISIQPLTVVSPYDDMHKDIASLAEEKRVAIILIPFHKRADAGGAWQEENSNIKMVNEHLLQRAPCSVGIFIDRGLGSFLHNKESSHGGSKQINALHIAMLFTSGPDSREALAYASRMAGSQDVILAVIRFIPGKEAENMIAKVKRTDNERQIDDDYVNEFRFNTMMDRSVNYTEKVVNTGDQIITAVGTTFYDYDMYIVGRGQKMITPFALGLTGLSEELGGLGHALSTSDFAKEASILVIHQHQLDHET